MKNLHSFKVKINGQKLEKCESYKYLGVFLDDQLNWKTHVHYINQKISKACGILAKLRHFCSLKVLKMVYYAIVYSYLQYCNVVWGNAHNITLRPLCRTLDKIMRIISFSPFNSSNISSIYKKFAILQLDKIH